MVCFYQQNEMRVTVCPQETRLSETLHVSTWLLRSAIAVKNLPAMQKTWVRSLGWQDALEKRKATHSSVLTCRIPGTV